MVTPAYTLHVSYGDQRDLLVRIKGEGDWPNDRYRMAAELRTIADFIENADDSEIGALVMQ
jgi:hypothetical protein